MIPDDKDEDTAVEKTNDPFHTATDENLPSTKQTREENLVDFMPMQVPTMTNVIEDDESNIIATSKQAELL